MQIEGITSSHLVYGPQRSIGEEKPAKDFIKDRAVTTPADTSNVRLNKKISDEELIRAIESVNKSVNVYDRKLEISIHELTKEIMVKVIDTNTNEVIREIPPEKVLDRVAKLWELAGILVDKKV